MHLVKVATDLPEAAFHLVKVATDLLEPIFDLLEPMSKEIGIPSNPERRQSCRKHETCKDLTSVSVAVVSTRYCGRKLTIGKDWSRHYCEVSRG